MSMTGGAIAWPSAGGGVTRNLGGTSKAKKSHYQTYEQLSSPHKNGRNSLDPSETLGRAGSTLRRRQRETSSIKRKNRVIDGSYLDEGNDSTTMIVQNNQKTY